MLSVIYKKIHGSINYIDYDTRLVTRPRSIHDFVILLGQNMDRGHVTIRVPEFIFWPKKKVSITGEDIGLLP